MRPRSWPPAPLSLLVGLGACLSIACADDRAQDGTETETETSSESTETETSSESTETETGDGDGDPGDGDGDPELCEPPDETVYFNYEPLDFGVDPWDADVDWSCTVETVDASAGLALGLDCPEAMQPITIEITSSPALLTPLVGGETIQLRFVSEGPFWFNEYLRLDLEGHGHLLTIVNGDSLIPPETYKFTLPLAIEPIYDACPLEDDFCGQLERLWLGFDGGGDGQEVLDGHYAVVGGPPGTEVWVVEAGHLHEIDCTDTPAEWFKLMIASTGQG